MKRKVLSLLLCFAMLFSLMPTMAFAAEDEEYLEYPVTIKLVDIAGDGVVGADLTLSGTTDDGRELVPYNWTSTGEGSGFELPPGTYTLYEDNAPAGYINAENITFTVKSGGTITIDGETVPEVVMVLDVEPAANCTVTFDSKGGSAVASQVFSDETFGELPVPERDGYQFDGWYVQDYQEQKSAEMFYDGTVDAQILRLSNMESSVSPTKGFADGNVIDFSVIFKGTKPTRLDLNDYYGFEDRYTINNNAIKGSIIFNGMQNNSGLGGNNWRTFIDIKTDITDTALDPAVGYEIQYFRVFPSSHERVTAESAVPAESAMTLYAGWSKIVICEHQWDAGTVTTPATCTENGEKTYTCTVCGETKTEEMNALGHTEVIDEAVAPTCTETGLTEGKYCSVCGEMLEAQETVAALGHTEVVDEAVAPTCTETGLTEGKHCSVCDAVLVAQETVDALGHTEVVDEAVAPTCTETGLTEGKHCSVCGEMLEAQETVEALGHTEVVDEAVAPTCTETGLTEGAHCSECGDVLVVQETVKALGHNFGEWTVIKEATETIEGSKERICSVCKETETATIPVLGHTHVFTTKASSQKATDATCEKAATYYVQCDGCDEVDTTKTVAVGDALGHAYGDWKKLNSTQHQRVCANDATHVEKANHNFKGNKCVDCGYTKSSGGSSGGGGGTYVGPTTSTTTTAAKPALTMEMQIGNKNYNVNDKTCTYDVAPFIVGNRTMIPVRVIMETLGAKVDWNEATRSVTITLDGKAMTMTIGKEIPGYGSAPIIRDSRTYVPIRYIMENTGAKVDWIAATG